MTRTRIFALLSILPLLLLTGCGQREAEERTVLFRPEKPGAADRITVRYRPDLSSSPLRSESPLFRFTLIGKEGKRAAEEIPLEKNGDAWEGSFTPDAIHPGDPVLLVGAFRDAGDPEVVDNDRGNPWILLLHDGDRTAEGARLQHYRVLAGLIRLNDPIRVPFDGERAWDELEREVTEYPDLAEARILRWALLLDQETESPAEAESTLAEARRDLGAFFAKSAEWTEPPAGTAKALSLIAKTEGEAFRDSLAETILSRFPRSPFTTDYLFQRAIDTDDRAVGAENLARFAREHPEAKEAVRARTYSAYIRLGSPDDRKEAERMIAEGEEMESFVLSFYAETLLEERERLEEAEATALRAIDHEEGTAFEWEDGRSPAEWERDRRETIASLLHLLARIREARGDGSGAAEAIGRALREYPEEATPEMLRRAAALLAGAGDAAGALEAYDRLGRTGRTDEETMGAWRALWGAHREGDFDAHAARLREQGRAEAMARLDRRALRWQAPEIRFLDMAGDTLTLADFRGRPVLIDFWATWCGPCRRGLPHLQAERDERVEAGDDLVVIPLNVWERVSGEERRETARTEWEKMGLTMPYYFDLERGEGIETAADLFDVPAIPTTCILGRDGTILFKTVGFDEEKGGEETRLRIDYALSH